MEILSIVSLEEVKKYNTLKNMYMVLKSSKIVSAPYEEIDDIENQ